MRAGFFALIALVGLAPCALAKTVYVRDTLYVPLRGGQGQEYRILHKGIRSGTPLEVLQENEETGYSLVRMEDGLEGWIQTQYLVDEPIARDLLDQANQKLDELEKLHEDTQKQLTDAIQERDALKSQYEALSKQFSDTSEELERIRQMAANVITIDEQNADLRQERERLDKQIDELMVSNDKLSDDSARDWFLRGGAVILVAVILGFWFGRRVYNRRNSGWA